jgi:hypothetical protein
LPDQVCTAPAPASLFQVRLYMRIALICVSFANSSCDVWIGAAHERELRLLLPQPLQRKVARHAGPKPIQTRFTHERRNGMECKMPT